MQNVTCEFSRYNIKKKKYALFRDVFHRNFNFTSVQQRYYNNIMADVTKIGFKNQKKFTLQLYKS